MRVLALAAALAAAGAATLPAQATRAPAPRATAPRAGADSLTARAFGALVARLSEPGGYFDTDNLISNERSYLHVVRALERRGVRGGAYVGVGPDQNFSYIARVRPRTAYVIDIRRDNLVQHLFFKALFARARNRMEYLALMLGRTPPPRVQEWSERPLERIAAYLDTAPAHPAADSLTRVLLAEARRSGVELTSADEQSLAKIHRSFIEGGLALQFTSFGRTPRPYYPTLRQLLLERDLAGRQASYLASERDFQFVKGLQRRNLVVPVVGNLAGDHALAEIGRVARERGERVSAFYTSNVEDYLMRDGSFPRFARTVAGLPRDSTSVIIRSVFGRFGAPPVERRPGYYSAQQLQAIDTFVGLHEQGALATYGDVVAKGALPLQ
jgi:hypothetical protein